MRAYPTRRDTITDKIEIFLADESRNTLHLRLYSREVKYVTNDYPNLTVEKGEQYKDTALWQCEIKKA